MIGTLPNSMLLMQRNEVSAGGMKKNIGILTQKTSLE